MLPSIRGLGPGADVTMRLFVRIGMSSKAAPKFLCVLCEWIVVSEYVQAELRSAVSACVRASFAPAFRP